MSAQQRSATPGAPRHRAPVIARTSTPAPPAEPASSAPSTAAEAASPRKCTDVCCLLLFLAVNGGLALQLRGSLDQGDLRRIRNGFDFRGRLCGADDDARASGRLLMWCPGNKTANETSARWSAPICVEACPSGGEQLQCPDGTVETVASEEAGYFDGSVTLVTTSRQLLRTATAGPTKKVLQYCFPLHLADEAHDILAAAAGGWQSALSAGICQMEGLMHSPELLGLLGAAACASGLIWIIMLRYFAKLLVHLAFQLATLLLLAIGTILLVGPSATDALGAASAACDAAAGNSTSLGGAYVLLGQAAEYARMGAWLGGGLGEGILARAVYLRLGVGVLFIALGVAVLLWYCFVKSSVAVAADALREGCRILLHQPTLVFILPLFSLLLTGLALVWTASGSMALLSTAEVRAAVPPVPGKPVMGVFRTFDLSPQQVGWLICWGFVFLWCQELVRALRSSVLAYAAVRWYRQPEGASDRTSFLPILAGARVALGYHCGSLALGAFVLACIRAVRWLLVLLHKLAADSSKEERKRGLQWLLTSLDCLVALAQEVVKRVSDCAFTEMILSSTPFCAASKKAAQVMMLNAPLLWMRNVVLRPAKYLGAISYSLAIGWVAQYLVAPSFPDAPPKALGVLAAGFALMAVLAFMAVLDGLSDALLYCYLRDGVEGSPDHFQKLVKPLTTA